MQGGPGFICLTECREAITKEAFMALPRRRIVLVFGLLSLFFFLIGFNNPQNDSPVNPTSLGVQDVWFIFIVNSLNVLLWFVLSLTGLSPLFIFFSIYGMGAGWTTISASPVLYYFSSATHGFLEWLACLQVFLFTVNHLYSLLLFFRGKVPYSQLKKFYLRVVKTVIPVTLAILLVAAFLEVYVSNKLLLILLK